MIELAEILRIPPKLMPIITDFNKYKFFIIEGGRGSSKTQTIARILSHIAEKRKVRIFCGREVQNTIEESVFTVLADLISTYRLAFDVKKIGITHLVTGSEFKFKGFRDQGAVNIKGVEGADIVWVDEAQSMTKTTLDVLIPTLREENCKLIFTMNRYMRDDAVMELVGRPDCLHIKINYFENPFCPLTLKHEAELAKNKSERDYRHIWLGEPLTTADDYLFNTDNLYAAYDVVPIGEIYKRQRIMGVDIAAEGNDHCVATIIDRVSNQHWEVTETIKWDENDTMATVGKIIALIGQYKPDVTMVDKGNMGKGVLDRLLEIPIPNVYPFDGATTDGVDSTHYVNARANAYYNLREWFDNGWIKLPPQCKEVVKQLEKIKMKYRSDGKRIIQAKLDMKKAPPIGIGQSPDDADSLMMAVWGAQQHLGKSSNTVANDVPVRRVSGSKRKK